MKTTFDRPGPGKVEMLENLREGSVVTRVRLAHLWATQLAHYVETSTVLQTHPKKFSFPSIAGWIEKDHKAMGIGVDADDSYESTFFVIRFNGGIIVRMRMLANEANGRLHWKIDGCSVEYPQNDWMQPQEVKPKELLRLGPDDVQRILNGYKEDVTDKVTIADCGTYPDAVAALRSGAIQVAAFVNYQEDPEGADWCHVVVARDLVQFCEGHADFEPLPTKLEGFARYFVNHAAFSDVVVKFSENFYVKVATVSTK